MAYSSELPERIMSAGAFAGKEINVPKSSTLPGLQKIVLELSTLAINMWSATGKVLFSGQGTATVSNVLKLTCRLI